jgi:TolB protein
VSPFVLVALAALVAGCAGGDDGSRPGGEATREDRPIDVSALEGRIAFSAGVDDVYVVNADGTRLERLTVDPAREFDPTWSSDGSRIAYRRETNEEPTSEIYVMDADGSRKTNLTRSAGVADWGPAWSPDGTRIAWNSDRGTPGEGLRGYVMNPDGSGVAPIGADVFFEYPAWSPDGKRLAFMAQTFEGGDNYEIYVVNADGTEPRRLTDAPGSDGWPAWSPDGTRIAFASERDDCLYSDREDCGTTGTPGAFHAIYVMDADGSAQTRLTDGYGQFADWSPDGRYIVFAPELNIMRPDGSGLTRLPVESLPPEPLMPDWGP